MISVYIEKKELRRRIKRCLAKLSFDEIEKKSKIIREKVLSSKFYASAKVIMFYCSVKYEVKTEEVISRALRDNKIVVLPKMVSGDIIPCAIREPGKDLKMNSYGIREPIDELVGNIGFKDIDLVFVPGLAFSLDGKRLGRGAGYYDRFLPKLKSDSLSAGLAFDCQIVEYVPQDEHDVPLSMVFTN